MVFFSLFSFTGRGVIAPLPLLPLDSGEAIFSPESERSE